MHFADRLCTAIDTKGSAVVVGLDPRLESLPSHLLADCRAELGNTPQAVAEGLWRFNCGIIDAVHDVVPAVKPQLAFYERYGLIGLKAYVRTVQYAKQMGLLVIADGKRGDIGSTASAYAEAFLGGDPQVCDQPAINDFHADALTVNPFLGHDGIQPFIDCAKKHGKGVFVLVKTSNPSAGDLQDLPVDGQPLYEHLGTLVEKWGESNRGRSGYSSVGAVVGATWPEQAARLRTLMPHTLFLVPGYGAQGAKASDVTSCFDTHGHGALVSASRSIIFAWRTEPYASRYSETEYKAAVREAAQRMGDEIRNAQF